MSTPIAALYSRPRSPYLSHGHPPTSPPPSSAANSSALPTPPRPEERRSPLKRATLSLDPRKDDPFAAQAPPARLEEEERARVAEGDEGGLGGEEWRVDTSLDRARQTGPQEPGAPLRQRRPPVVAPVQETNPASVRRRSSTSSFLRALVPRPLRSSTSTSTSTSLSTSPTPAAPALAKLPRRARSSIQLERISAPLAGSARGGSLRVRGTVELIGVQEARERRRSWVEQAEAEPEAEARAPAQTEERASPPLRQSASARSLRRRGSLGTLLFPRRASAAVSATEGGAHEGEGDKPTVQPTKKTLKVLGNLVGSIKGDETRHAPAHDDGDVVGLALTTDEPTRRIVPDNARYSFATLSSSVGSMRSRALTSTASSVRSPSISRRRVLSSGTTLSRHLEEAGSESPQPTASRPLSPPPNVPLPALPTASPSTTSLPRINFTAPTPGTTPASHRVRTTSRPPLPPGLAPEPAESPGSPPSPNMQATVKRVSSRASTLRREPPPQQPQQQSQPQDEPQRPPRPPRASARTIRSNADEQVEAHDRSARLHFDNAPTRDARSRTVSGVSAATDRTSRAPVSSADVRAQDRATKRTGSSFAPAQSTAGPRDPLASLYLVCGLPKEVRNWREAERVDGEERRWKAEVLGVMEGARREGEAQVGEEVRRLERDERDRVQAKALKLAFDRDVEVIASPTQPPATTAFFSFTTLRPSSSASSSVATEQRYHCVSLLVWSHSDDTRAAAASALLRHSDPPRATRSQVEAEAVRRAAKAARAGKRLSSQLLGRMRGAEEEDGTDGGTTTTGGAASETETEGRLSFDLEDAPAMPSPRLFDDFDSEPLWLPYAIVLVSTSPLYTLLSDVVRLSWARYHQDLASHSLQMERLLKAPTPFPGETLRVPVGSEYDQRETFFVASMPGKIDWSTTVTASNYPMWPVFKALHADNLLTVAELALAPLGRVVFISRHRIMLSLATMTFQAILEMRGWKGLAFPSVHARDLKLFLEDPGPWLLGMPASQATSALLSSLSPDIVVVDLDDNLVSCARPFPGAVSTGSTRDKARRRLEAVTGDVGRNEVPLELVEAFPGGRFRPFSLVEVDGELRAAERLKPDVAWQWDESRVLKELDSILADTPRVTVLGRILRRKAPRKSVDLDSNLKQVQAVVREHTTTFVEQRDALEAEIYKANRRLQVLMNQSAEWTRAFSTFKEFSERATAESVELKMRLERERREARRLTGQLAADREHQAQLEDSLEAVERAREQALEELARVDSMRRNLEQHRALVAQEIQAIVQGAEDDSSPLYQAVYSRIEALSQRSDTPSLRSTSAQSNRPPSRLARQPSYMADRIPDVISEEEELSAAQEVLEEEARLESMRLALQETLRAVSSRLSLALQAAGEFGDTASSPQDSTQASSSFDTSSPSRSAESDATLVSSTSPTTFRPPASPDVGPFDKPQSFSPTGSPALGFHPKTLTLTPPVSPELGSGHESAVATSDFAFVTTRPHQQQPRRYRPRAQGHLRDDSAGGASILSCSSGTSASMTPPARSSTQSFFALSTPTGATKGHGRTASQGRGPSRSPTYSRSASAMSLSHPQGPAHSRSPSALSQLSYVSSSPASETDDAASFVSVSEGVTGCGGGSGGGGETSTHDADHFELEELAAHAVSPTPQARRKSGGGGGGHTREDSFAIDAPPVALFTRSGSLRSLNGSGRGAAVSGGGGKGRGDVDTPGRVRATVQRYEQRV